MKLLFVIVSLIVVYTTHSRDIPNVQQLKETSLVVPETSGLHLQEMDGQRKKKIQSKQPIAGGKLHQNGNTCVGSIDVGGKCLTFSDDKLNWVKAAASCVANGSQLVARADPQALLDYVLTHYGSVYFWVGGSDAAQEGVWTWVTGEGIDNELPWGRNEPNNGGNQDCLAVNYKAGYDDGKCKKKHRYICEKLASTNRTTTTTATTTTTTTATTTTTTTMHTETTTEPESILVTVGSDRFVVFNEKMNWTSARALCINHTLDLYQPNDILAVANYLNGTFSDYYWLGARGNGANMVWLSGEVLQSDAPWQSSGEYYDVSTDQCLDFYTSGGSSEARGPLVASGCGTISYVLCG